MSQVHNCNMEGTEYYTVSKKQFTVCLDFNSLVDSFVTWYINADPVQPFYCFLFLQVAELILIDE